MSTGVILSVVQVHVEESSALYFTRTRLASTHNIRLAELRAVDLRLMAHLDGVAVAGEHAWPLCAAALETPTAGSVFTATVRTIEEKDERKLQDLLALSEGSTDLASGFLCAFGWLERDRLQGIVASLLSSKEPFKRYAGVAVCAMHRVDPGLGSPRLCRDQDPRVRARALRALGELGLSDLIAASAGAVHDSDPECRFWSVWSRVLLGDRGAALAILTEGAASTGLHRLRAFRLSLQAMKSVVAHAFLKSLASPQNMRWLIQGSGIAGDPTYVPWLIDYMRDDTLARLAGESFSLITGLDLSWHEYERPRPENFESGPTDNPDDENVEMDPDEGLPWPDADKVEKWWAANAHRFQKGVRYFMGAPVTREHCINVLKNGYQRQRILAAHYLCLLEPGTPLFNTSAPAWRQQRLLARM